MTRDSRRVIDAEFEVIADPRRAPSPYVRPRMTASEAANSFRWMFVWLIIGLAGFTMLIGLAGGLEPKAPEPKPVPTPAGAIAIPTVPSY